MKTPEGKVKDKIKSILDKYGDEIYYFSPMTGGYGRSGVPDIVISVRGRFVAVECKTTGNKPTALQLKNLEGIVRSGGYAYVIDETSVGLFALTVDQLINGTIPIESSRQVNDWTFCKHRYPHW